jgi:hypothetical protein
VIPTECADIDSDKDGVYTIIPKGGVKEVSVFCLMRGQNNKWTVRPNIGIIVYILFFCLSSRWYISIFFYILSKCFFIIRVHNEGYSRNKRVVRVNLDIYVFSGFI